jgi:hypothetical protein
MGVGASQSVQETTTLISNEKRYHSPVVRTLDGYTVINTQPPNVECCRAQIERMLERSQTKILLPILTLGLLREYKGENKVVFFDAEIKACYSRAVKWMKDRLGHSLNFGGKYYDAYSSRNLPKYRVLRALGEKRYELLAPYTTEATDLLEWIPARVAQHIQERLGLIPSLGERECRSRLSADPTAFVNLVSQHFDRNAANFEIFSFAIIKVHLEKFACRVYRDTRTTAHDCGVDLSTNFGVVYQIKKMKVLNRADADSICAELRINFDRERLQDGNVILVIDDISREVKNYLIDMKIQSISKHDLLRLASHFEDPEDREKVLRFVYQEFSREYSSDL